MKGMKNEKKKKTTTNKRKEIFCIMKKIICLVGPSGAGKTAICEWLLKNNNLFAKVKTATTRNPRPNETENAYHFLSKENFEKKINMGKFLEFSEYAGEFYGTPTSSVDDIITSKKVAIVPIDIRGAKAYKDFYKDDVSVVFVYRDKKTIIEAIVERDIPSSEKSKRILQLDKEFENISLCDRCVINNHSLADAGKQINEIVFA